MPATEIVTTIVGKSQGKDIHAPTGQIGNSFPDVSDWVVGRKKAGLSVQDVTSTVLVEGLGQNGIQWAAYEEMVEGVPLLTIFEIKP